jgi:hypothetical protein
VSAISGTSTSAPSRARARDRLEVDLGLAGAGDAVEQERREGSDRARDRLERRGLRGREREGRGGGREEPAAHDRHLALEPDDAAPRERRERGAPARESGAQLLDGDSAADEQVLEDRALRPCARERGDGVGGAGFRRGVLDAAALGRGGPLARVEPRRQRRTEQLAGWDEVVLLRPADELDELRRERRDRVQDLGHVAQG